MAWLRHESPPSRYGPWGSLVLPTRFHPFSNDLSPHLDYGSERTAEQPSTSTQALTSSQRATTCPMPVTAHHFPLRRHLIGCPFQPQYQCWPLRTDEFGHLLRGKIPPVTGPEISHGDRSDRHTHKPQRRMPDGSCHSPNLPVHPFTQREFQPGRRNMLTKSNRNGPFR